MVLVDPSLTVTSSAPRKCMQNERRNVRPLEASPLGGHCSHPGPALCQERGTVYLAALALFSVF